MRFEPMIKACQLTDGELSARRTVFIRQSDALRAKYREMCQVATEASAGSMDESIAILLVADKVQELVFKLEEELVEIGMEIARRMG